jgi:hypothetical protein
MKMRVLYHYDVWGNSEDGYDVNDSIVVYEGKALTDEELMDLFANHTDPNNLDIMWYSDSYATVDRQDGEPAFSIYEYE